MKIVLAIFFVIFSFLIKSGEAFAYDLPSFTSCVNPQGIIKANYETGTHGIAGRTGNYSGKDTVYTISANSLTQCFCAVDGSGIQTNWWKIPQLSLSEIKSFEAQGWIYIPNGALWGLDNAPYLAKNSDFSCKGDDRNNDKKDNPGSSNPSSSGNSSSGSGGIGQVLGLASTGNSIFVLATALTSGVSLLLGLILKKKSRNFSK